MAGNHNYPMYGLFLAFTDCCSWKPFLGKLLRHLFLPGITLNSFDVEKGGLLDGFLCLSFVIDMSDVAMGSFCLLT